MGRTKKQDTFVAGDPALVCSPRTEMGGRVGIVTRTRRGEIGLVDVAFAEDKGIPRVVSFARADLLSVPTPEQVEIAKQARAMFVEEAAREEAAQSSRQDDMARTVLTHLATVPYEHAGLAALPDYREEGSFSQMYWYNAHPVANPWTGDHKLARDRDVVATDLTIETRRVDDLSLSGVRYRVVNLHVQGMGAPCDLRALGNELLRIADFIAENPVVEP